MQFPFCQVTRTYFSNINRCLVVSYNPTLRDVDVCQKNSHMPSKWSTNITVKRIVGQSAIKYIIPCFQLDVHSPLILTLNVTNLQPLVNISTICSILGRMFGSCFQQSSMSLAKIPSQPVGMLIRIPLLTFL